MARESWTIYVTTRTGGGSPKTVVDAATFGLIWELVLRVLLDPSGLYLQVNPPQPALLPSAPQSRKGSGKNTPIQKRNEELPARKAEDEEENEADRKARLRISGFGATEWMLGPFSLLYAYRIYLYGVLYGVSVAQSQISSDESTVEAFLKPLDNAALWSALYSGQHAPFVDDDDFESFGWNQPGVRRACWGTLQALLKLHKGSSHCRSISRNPNSGAITLQVVCMV